MVMEGQGQDAAAERHYRLAASLADKMPVIAEADNEIVAKMYQNYAALLRKMKRSDEAKKMETRAKGLTKAEKP